MPKNEDHIADLVRKYWMGTLSDADAAALDRWKEENPRYRAFFEQIRSSGYFSQSQQRFAKVRKAEIAKRVQKEFYFELENEAPVPRFRYRVSRVMLRWASAAAIVITLTGLSLYYIFSHTTQPESTRAQNAPLISDKNDVSPGFNRAVLTLSNGQKVELNNAASGTIKDGTLSIENNDGQLIYKKEGAAAMNTMTTPKGGQYKLTLTDGTKVWLNAASSITYPMAFNGKTREVSITGEAYFEVSRNKTKPFIVKTPHEDIAVLGTSFNVNAYEDEPAMKVSLLEGSVKVGELNIAPGQAYQKGQVKATDLNEDLAWKNGAFYFKNADLEAVMRQFARWYDVEVIYEKRKVNKEISGDIGRDLNLSEVLEGLKGLGVKSRIEGKKLFVAVQ